MSEYLFVAFLLTAYLSAFIVLMLGFELLYIHSYGFRRLVRWCCRKLLG